ncbi:MAG: ABC transporter substrate-binding protein [Dissulfurispiraceae bacterium]
MRLRIGHLSTFYHTAIILMADERLEKELGINVEWRLFGNGPSIVNAFEKGELDLAYAGLPPVLIGIDRGVRIKCVAGGHIEGTVVSARAGYKGFPETEDLGEILAQFSGGKIGVPGKGSIHDVILSDCLRKYTLEGEVTVVNFQWSDRLTEAVIHDEVSAAFGTPALAAALKFYANGRVLYPPSLLWPNNPSYGIIAENRFLERSGDIIERFLVQHEMATLLLRDRQQEAAEIISRLVGFVEEALVLTVLRLSPKYCAKVTAGYISATMAFVRVMRSLGYVQREMMISEIFDTSVIDKIHPEEDHYTVRENIIR